MMDQADEQRINELKAEVIDAPTEYLRDITLEALDCAMFNYQSTKHGLALAIALNEWVEWQKDAKTDEPTRREIGRALWFSVTEHVHALTGCRMAMVEIG